VVEAVGDSLLEQPAYLMAKEMVATAALWISMALFLNTAPPESKERRERERER